MVQKRADKENKDKRVSPLAILTTLNICGSMQLPHHKVIHKNGKHNTATTNNNINNNTGVSDHITAHIL